MESYWSFIVMLVADSNTPLNLSGVAEHLSEWSTEAHAQLAAAP
jgi:hypothetical protein